MSGHDIPLRNLDKKIVAKLEQEAKKKGISREEYLKILLAKNFYENDQVAVTNQYKEILIWNTRILCEISEGHKNIVARMERLDTLINELMNGGNETDGY